MGRRSVSFPLFVALLAASVLLAGAFATPTIGAGGDGASAAKTKKKKYAPISGKLSKGGYTVIVLADSGRAKTVQLKRHRWFRLRPPAKRVTLHLRAPNGTYAGPIVVGSERHGKQVVLGVSPGAKLGMIKLKGGKGYAKLRHRLAKKWILRGRWARAKNGVPIGNGRNVGLVRSRKAHGPASDPDLDGVPNSIDVDDDGDRILDQYDRSSSGVGARNSRALATASENPALNLVKFGLTTDLGFAGGALLDATNVNGGSSDAQIAAAQQKVGRLGIGWIGLDAGTAELDCGNLVYCSAHGTGRLQEDPHALREESPEFPECCDPDHNGLGALNTLAGFGNYAATSIYHGATADQIRAGDVLVLHGKAGGTPVEAVSSVGFVFSTFPVLAAYDDGQGDSASLTYPLPPDACSPPGSANCPLPVRAGPNGEVVVRLTFWRPQRKRLAGDPGEGEWMDVGNLLYATSVGSAPGVCPQSSYSGMDPSLAPDPTSGESLGPPTLGGIRFEDLNGDQPSSPANTFSYTLNLTNCLAAAGQSFGANERESERADASFWAFSVNAEKQVTAGADSFAQFELQP